MWGKINGFLVECLLSQRWELYRKTKKGRVGLILWVTSLTKVFETKRGKRGGEKMMENWHLSDMVNPHLEVSPLVGFIPAPISSCSFG